MGMREGRQKGRGRGEREEYMKKLNGGDSGRTERESKERYILIEGVTVGLVRILSLRKFLGTHKDVPN